MSGIASCSAFIHNEEPALQVLMLTQPMQPFRNLSEVHEEPNKLALYGWVLTLMSSPKRRTAQACCTPDFAALSSGRSRRCSRVDCRRVLDRMWPRQAEKRPNPGKFQSIFPPVPHPLANFGVVSQTCRFTVFLSSSNLATFKYKHSARSTS